MANQPEKEIRFAVVMYGGVSLAIYINGVTQELNSLVRATARSREKSDAYHIPVVQGVEAVYRELGETLKARFVIDILSGTSAGGINAVYLAKALANGQQIDKLKELWVSQGDINLLVNDRESTKNVDLKAPKKPTSLLNSQRMYYQLLLALQGMKVPGDSSQAGSGASPYVEDLDLFVTATDLRGLKAKIRLSGGNETEEYRYRNVFHFQYATEASGDRTNDFKEENDPFLAFAARCTSSFPFAFEPMRLKDIEEILKKRPFGNYKYTPDEWFRFFTGYEAKGIPDIPFGDGGYLDNKPFSYATATLKRRHARLPVDRKLIYIEPAPEHLNKPEEEEPPDAIQNVLDALLILPRYETIREDLQVVDGRNTMVRRTNHIVRNIESIHTREGFSLKPWMPSKDWRRQYLDQLINTAGPGYLAYHQLRMEDVLTDLNNMIVHAFGWEEDGPEADDLASLLGDWRRTYYKTISNEKDGSIPRMSENDILFRLDTGWRVRRLSYLRELIDDMLNDLGGETWAEAGPRLKGIFDHSRIKMPSAKTEVAAYRTALQWVKNELNLAYDDLRLQQSALRSKQPTGVATEMESGTPFDRKRKELKVHLEKIGRDTSVSQGLQDMNRFSQAHASNIPLTAMEEEYYQGALRLFEELTLTLSNREAASDAPAMEKGFLRTAISDSSARCSRAMTEGSLAEEQANLSKDEKRALAKVRECLRFYFERYEFFDMLTFPITYGTESGEADEVEVIRISPEDATSLKKREESHTKLLGTKLASFGAFFNGEWRENDMLWGRLDGAECIINALLPDPADTLRREKYIRDAQLAILQEFRLTETGKTALPASSPSTGNTPASLVTEFTRNYKVNPEFPAKETLEVTGRATRVTGDLLGALADKYSVLTNPATLISRIGQIFLSIVQVAVPGSIPDFVFHNLIVLIYLAELILFFGGQFFKQTALASFGLTALIATMALHISVLSVRNILAKKWRGKQFLQAFLFLLAVLLAVGAGALIYTGLIYLGAFPEPAGPSGWFLNLLKGIWSE